mgnify:CR=1 FL=1
MYLETVKKITEVENEMEQAKAAARAQVQQQLTEAEREGKKLLQRAQAEDRARREAALAAGGEERLSPPKWSTARYRVTLVRSAGRWKISNLQLIEQIAEE